MVKFSSHELPNDLPIDPLARTHESSRLSPEERYRRDPLFHALVNMIEAAFESGDYTPTEIKEALVLAEFRILYRKMSREFIP